MIIGVPKEIKPSENRVALTPVGTMELARHGHEVYIQKNAGKGSGFSDEMYAEAGAQILDSIEEVYNIAEMILKVKEPIEQEYELIKDDQLIFTFFHFASSEALTQAMIKNNSVCIAYETVELSDRSLPLLIPMSEVAGRMATQQGAKYLEKPQQGMGLLLGGVPGTRPAEVLVLGGGIVGSEAAKMAAGLGASVTILDKNLHRIRELAEIMPANVRILYSSELTIRELAQKADFIVGAVLIPGAKAPHLITSDMIKTMKPGSVVVDVAVDQGGCIETSHPTTHDDPVFMVDDVVHYCVANMPGAVPFTSTMALTNATLPYAIALADMGWKKACSDIAELKLGLNVVHGDVVYKAVADAFDLPYVEVDTIL